LKNDSQFLLGASQGTETYKSTLGDPLRQIRGTGSADEINNFVGALEKETNQMLGRSRALEEKLKSTTSEIDALRQKFEGSSKRGDD
tara:strand:- start:748 stop:1008 length:261 start_codon:yes stop_codon:yes gene_type:complete